MDFTRLVGGWALPLWKMMEFISWDDEIPNWMGKKKFQTTNQMISRWRSWSLTNPSMENVAFGEDQPIHRSRFWGKTMANFQRKPQIYAVLCIFRFIIMMNMIIIVIFVVITIIIVILLFLFFIWLVVDLPLWNILVSWDHYSQCMENMKKKFQTSNQLLIIIDHHILPLLLNLKQWPILGWAKFNHRAFKANGHRIINRNRHVLISPTSMLNGSLDTNDG